MLAKIQHIIRGILKFLGSPLGTIFKVCVSLLIVWYFFNKIDPSKLLSILQQIKWPFLLFIVGLILVRNHISAFRFQVLSSFWQKINIWILNKHYFIASMFNIFLPSTIGGDAVRIFLLEREGMKKTKSAQLIFVERFVGFFSLSILALVGIFLISLPWTVRLMVVGINAAFLLIAFLLFLPRLGIKILENFRDRFSGLKIPWSYLVKVFLISILFQLVSIYIRYLVAIAFELEIDFRLFLVFIPLINVVTLLPISLGGVGLRELSFVYFFSNMGGFSEETSLVLALSTYFIFIVTGLIGAALYFYDQIVLNIVYSFKNHESDS